MRSQQQTTEPHAERPEPERFSRQLTDLLSEMVRTEEMALPPEWSGLAPGAQLGRFELVSELGRGGFGVVWEARDVELGRAVALKLVRPGSRIASHGAAWLRREAEAVARLNHPGIVTLYDVGHGTGGVHLVFELLRGETLAQRLRAGPLPVDEVLRVGEAVAAALMHAHAAGVIHRDLTPGNVHLGENGAVKVLDFGLSHLFGREGASDGGTAAYMAPEQWRGEAGDGRTDLFALGAILHEALSGQPPFGATGSRSEVTAEGPRPELQRGVAPAPLRRLVRQLLERDPARRPASAGEVEQRLRRKRRRHRAQRGRRWLAAGAVAAVALVAALGAVWWQATRTPRLTELPEAARRYEEGVSCLRTASAIPGFGRPAIRAAEIDRCASPFREALALDPGLAAAHFRLAQINALTGAPGSSDTGDLDAALAAVDRLPPREGRLVRALDARRRERLSEASRLYAEALDEDPADDDALDGAVTVAIEREDWTAVIAPALKRVSLYPESEDARFTVVEALGRTGRMDELRALRNGWWSERARAGRTQAVVMALIWLGDPVGAVEVAREGVAAQGDAALPVLRSALSASGAFPEMEVVALRYADAYHQDPWQRLVAAVAMAAQGRTNEALALADAVAPHRHDLRDRAFWDAMLTAATWNPRQTRRAAERAVALDAYNGSELAVPLLLMGDVEGAATLASAIPPGSLLHEEYRALRSWRAGDADGALSRLEASEARDAWPVHGVSPTVLIAEVASAAGDHRAALTAAQRYLRLPARGIWRAWAYPRVLLIQARAEAGLGRQDEARRTLARLQALWAHADPAHPLVAEIRALDAELRRVGSASGKG